MVSTEVRIAYVDKMCWAFSMGGEHYTGKVCWYRDGVYTRTELSHPLLQWQATELNKKEKCRGGSAMYRKGQVSDRFWSEDDLFEAAVEFAKGEPRIDILLTHDGAQPTHVLWSRDERLGKRLHALGLKMEAMYEGCNDPWRRWPDKCQKLTSQWDRLLGRGG